MKKISLLLAAFALVAGLSQCRKPAVKMNAAGYVGTTQNVTFSTDGNGSKISLDNALNALNMTWDGSDVLHVYGSASSTFNGGMYCGSLAIDPECAGQTTATFTGTLENVPATGSLRFYYFASGCGFSSEAHTATLDLSSQNGNIAGEGSLKDMIVTYVDVKVNDEGQYSGTMELPYAVVKFNLQDLLPQSGSISVTMSGIEYNGIQFKADGTMENVAVPTVGDNAGITSTFNGVSPENAAGYIVAAMPVTSKTVCLSGNNKIASKNVTIAKNVFYTKNDNGDGVEFPVIEPEPGKFHVSADKVVIFSKGNLQYWGQAQEGQKWRFAEKQWHVLGGGPGWEFNHGNVDLGTTYAGKYNTGSGSPDMTDDDKAAVRDLFGWGTSGFFHQEGVTGNFSWQPYATVNDYRGEYYAYGYNYKNLDSQTPATADWGYNEIYNEGTGWRTLTGGEGGEWEYLLKKRADANGNRLWGLGTVAGTNGLIILPDDWNTPEGLSFTYGKFLDGNLVGQANFSDNTFSETEWTMMETAGAVFLPTGGYRTAGFLYNVGTHCHYWSSTNCTTGEKSAHELYVGENVVSPTTASGPKNVGRLVRLVKECE